ncbi:YfjI family protein [Paenirhodobacter sp. CAU 1674]|uniref:YfjI family protein n=1 Tax=Paenirhodobacter sp. CAU 1674 TaxID=3032596 RepID=UPI0023DB9745|nr:YfjI family protein [Paenirhodobacter sp. CAU 1674]MDF2143139.1 YfjI family protein [Paenirhodobacter sp. CAU 1674]
MNALPQEIPYRPEGPQPLVRSIAAGDDYPVQALGPLRAAVEAVQGMTLAPVAIPAASALAVASLAVQGFADVETLGGPRPVSLYVLTIAQSGERKSSCDSPLMAALRAYEREQALAQREEIAAWENAFALWKGERDRILNDAKKGKGEKRVAARADLEALGKAPSAPPGPERTLPAPSMQGLIRQYRENQPSSGLFSDEGGKFFGGFAMASENRLATLAALNDLWGGAPVRIGLGGEGVYTLYGRRLAVHLMVQPGVARAFMADPMAGDTGFLPRFLICEPPSNIGNRPQSQVRRDDLALEAFGARLRAVLETSLPMAPETRELMPRLLPLSADARAMLSAFADHVEAGQAPGAEFSHVTGQASKAAEQAARIAGVLTLWRNLDAPEVKPATMADAITLAGFYLSEATRLADAATVSAEIDKAERLRKWLLESWAHPEITPREVVQSAPIRALRESPSARAALASLEKHGWLIRLPEGAEVRGASRKEAYQIVRAAHEV